MDDARVKLLTLIDMAFDQMPRPAGSVDEWFPYRGNDELFDEHQSIYEAPTWQSIPSEALTFSSHALLYASEPVRTYLLPAFMAAWARGSSDAGEDMLFAMGVDSTHLPAVDALTVNQTRAFALCLALVKLEASIVEHEWPLDDVLRAEDRTLQMWFSRVVERGAA